jgi:hypothetical protein
MQVKSTCHFAVKIEMRAAPHPFLLLFCNFTVDSSPTSPVTTVQEYMSH